MFLAIYKVTFKSHTTYYHLIMAELRALRSAITRTDVTQYIKVESFVGQGFARVGDLKTLTPCTNPF